MDNDGSKMWWIRMTKKIVSLGSAILKTEFPGSREGDSQIVADERGTGNSISILPQHQAMRGQRKILFCQPVTDQHHDQLRIP